jgi:hypothetical protein
MNDANERQSTFSTQQFDSIYPDGVQDHYWVAARNRILYRWVRGFLHEPILEIGAGRGICVAYLNARGVQIRGVEPAACAVPPEVAHLVTRGCDAQTMPDGLRAQYKALALLDVIEHIADAPAFLNSLAGAYPQADAMLITVPARTELFSNYDAFNGHYRRYDMASLGRDIVQAGLQVVRIRYCFHTLYWPVRVQLAATGKRATSFHVPSGLMKTIHSLLAWLLVLEAAVLPPAWPGTSLIAIARRPAAGSSCLTASPWRKPAHPV